MAGCSLPAQGQNCGFPDEPSLPNSQLLTLGDAGPHEIRVEEFHGHDARLSWPQRLHFGKVKPSVKEITIDAQWAAPPVGGSRPRSPACVRREQPQLDESIRSPKRHHVPFKVRSLVTANDRSQADSAHLAIVRCWLTVAGRAAVANGLIAEGGLPFLVHRKLVGQR